MWSAACVSLGPQVIPEAHYRITKQELYSFFYAFQAFSNPRAVCNRSIPHAKAEALMLLPCPPMKAPDSSGNCRKDTTLFREVSQKYIYRCTYQIFTEHLLNKRHHTSSMCHQRGIASGTELSSKRIYETVAALWFSLIYFHDCHQFISNDTGFLFEQVIKSIL